MFRVSTAAFLLLAVLSAHSGCSDEPQANPAASPAVPGTLTTEAEWTDLKGLQERLGKERGRVVVVNYWATWCEPCREEFPELIEFSRQWKDRGVVFLSVSLDAASARDTEVKKFLDEQHVPFPVFIKTDADDPDDFINAMDPKWTGVLPATFVYDRAGQRRHSLFGPQTRELLERAVKPLLASEPGV